ncbi:hypothetical protein [Oceanobacillus indicireducens]|uniref:hypothetical protein n=1 Tax=Oceanobacillus indicireducens TaxID=1004261 RepID=UPI001669816E|nr:hypothetical protein [Oceanobacillus indicireducens]
MFTTLHFRFVPTIFLGSDFYFFYHPDLIRKIDKIEQIQLAQKCKFLIPKTIISNNKNDIEDFLEKHVQNGLIIKTMNSHYTEYNGKLYEVFGKVIYENNLDIEELAVVPTIIQELIRFSKEARVTVIGDKVMGALIHKDSNEGDWHHEGVKHIKSSTLEVPKDIQNKCVNFLKEAQLDYGAFDFMITQEDEWYFLEVNPLGDWRWVELDTGQNITKEIVDYFINKTLNDKEGNL